MCEYDEEMILTLSEQSQRFEPMTSVMPVQCSHQLQRHRRGHGFESR